MIIDDSGAGANALTLFDLYSDALVDLNLASPVKGGM